MTAPDTAALLDLVDRFEQQRTTGEWTGPAAEHWLSGQKPCGAFRPCMCKGLRGRRAVVWSQVMAAPDPWSRDDVLRWLGLK